MKNLILLPILCLLMGCHSGAQMQKTVTIEPTLAPIYTPPLPVMATTSGKSTEASPIEVTLAWDPSPDPVSAYKLYFGTNSAEYFGTNNTGTNLQWTVSGLEADTLYYFAATAIGTNALESDFSNEISYRTQQKSPEPPQNVGTTKIPVFHFTIGFSDVPGSWEGSNTVEIVVATMKPYQFFTVITQWMSTVEGVRIE